MEYTNMCKQGICEQCEEDNIRFNDYEPEITDLYLVKGKLICKTCKWLGEEIDGTNSKDHNL
jgi:hypothetical protein